MNLKRKKTQHMLRFIILLIQVYRTAYQKDMYNHNSRNAVNKLRMLRFMSKPFHTKIPSDTPSNYNKKPQRLF